MGACKMNYNPNEGLKASELVSLGRRFCLTNRSPQGPLQKISSNAYANLLDHEIKRREKINEQAKVRTLIVLPNMPSYGPYIYASSPSFVDLD